MSKTESGEKISPEREEIRPAQEVQAQSAAATDEGSAQDGASGAEAGSPEDTEERIEEQEESPEKALYAARAEAQENYDRFLRATAELDNYRKRTAKVRAETREEALRDVLLQIAPILDNMRRALAQENKDVDVFKQGVELIYSQFQETLKAYGLEEIEAVGQPFDPTLHEALMEIEHQEHPPGTVVEEMEKGYRLNSKVVRPARVIVSKAGGEDG
jgi:molecular chaperone GrpE